jgi:hypothetical protein
MYPFKFLPTTSSMLKSAKKKYQTAPNAKCVKVNSMPFFNPFHKPLLNLQ